MRIIKIFIIFLSLFYPNLYSKILIFTYAFNRPDFIEFQYKTFKKFIEDEYEFIVFSDAKTTQMHQKIKTMCNKYGIKCIRIPQKIHDIPYLERPATGNMANYHSPSVRNCNVVQYSLNTVGFKHNDIVMLIDSDMFLIKRLSIREYLENFELGGVFAPCNLVRPPHNCEKAHPGIPPFKYLWIGLVFLNMKTMPNKKTINFNCGYVHGISVDAGGYTAHYLMNNPNVKVKGFDKFDLEKLLCTECKKRTLPAAACQHNTKTLESIGLDQYAINFAQSMPRFPRQISRSVEFLAQGHFLHYRGGTNYHNFPTAYHAQKTKLFNAFINTILQQKG